MHKVGNWSITTFVRVTMATHQAAAAADDDQDEQQEQCNQQKQPPPVFKTSFPQLPV